MAPLLVSLSACLPVCIPAHARTHTRAHDRLPPQVHTRRRAAVPPVRAGRARPLTAVSPAPDICWRFRLFVKSVEMWIEPYCVPALLCAGPCTTPRLLRHSLASLGLPATGEMDNKRPVPRQTESREPPAAQPGAWCCTGHGASPGASPGAKEQESRGFTVQPGESGRWEGAEEPGRDRPRPSDPARSRPGASRSAPAACPRSRPSSPTTAVWSCCGGRCDTPSSARWPGSGASAPATSSGLAW